MRENTIDSKFLEIVKQVAEGLMDESVFDKDFLDRDLLDLEIDSITFIKLIVALENEFDIEFDDGSLDAEYFNTLQKLKEYVEERLQVTESNSSAI
ncbi:acyl carrier protein [Paenibacillus cellulosilyticus]|uniref:Acyl carrier protein n=1 Tax=Paenibacillus cellulosilyticus TaxID=375489 RepID=A0A2V2YZW3_9BACL|nr:acyl carrier protein [Paenibacillus cellulosilyticus]PWW07337.1 acyl carrier protein [Paenibacillus cellulosilyticus]QKS44485.1 acyl carrier protein [Paenibacillus cellulosilyticus]